MRQRIVLLLVVLAAPLVVWQGSMLVGRYYYGSVAQSPSPSVPAEGSVSGTSPPPTERTSASAMPTEETTAPEETTTFQAPKGTKASSTARIVCLRADQGTSSPPPMSTEALNGHSLTRVLTPKVAAHPDGVHLQIDNRLSKAASLHKAIYYGPNETPSQPTVTGDLPKGKSNHVVLEFLPGIEDIACASPDWYYALTFASMEVVVGESGYKSLELECKKGARPSFGAAADFGGYTGSHPVEQARKHFSERLEKGDVVEEAGYPQAPDPKPVRVVRNGKVVAAIDYDASGYYVTYCDGQI